MNSPISTAPPRNMRRFSRVTLPNGLQQVITLQELGDGETVLALGVFRANECIARIFWKRDALEPLERALALLRDPAFRGTRCTGDSPIGGGGLAACVTAHRSVIDCNIRISRERDGEQWGAHQTLRGDELDALRFAIFKMKKGWRS